jgi:hypothetical protein
MLTLMFDGDEQGKDDVLLKKWSRAATKVTTDSVQQRLKVGEVGYDQAGRSGAHSTKRPLNCEAPRFPVNEASTLCWRPLRGNDDIDVGIDEEIGRSWRPERFSGLAHDDILFCLLGPLMWVVG